MHGAIAVINDYFGPVGKLGIGLGVCGEVSFEEKFLWKQVAAAKHGLGALIACLECTADFQPCAVASTHKKYEVILPIGSPVDVKGRRSAIETLGIGITIRDDLFVWPVCSHTETDE
jgi:hypothetical protein